MDTKWKCAEFYWDFSARRPVTPLKLPMGSLMGKRSQPNYLPAMSKFGISTADSLPAHCHQERRQSTRCSYGANMCLIWGGPDPHSRELCSTDTHYSEHFSCCSAATGTDTNADASQTAPCRDSWQLNQPSMLAQKTPSIHGAIGESAYQSVPSSVFSHCPRPLPVWTRETHSTRFLQRFISLVPKEINPSTSVWPVQCSHAVNSQLVDRHRIFFRRPLPHVRSGQRQRRRQCSV